MVALLLTMIVFANPGDNQIELLKTFNDEFVKITPGEAEYPKSFLMGSEDGSDNEAPTHRVTFDYSFSIAKYEVPQNLWESVMGSNPSSWKGPRNSVEKLSFDEAQTFCRKVTELMRAAKLIGGDQVIRLPTEAEWEYAARAGTKSRYSFGDDSETLDAYGWYTGNASGNDPQVGEKAPNPWGLYDVHGYLWEWCSDTGTVSYEKAPDDGSADKSGDPKRRMIRGGSWKDDADQLTSSFRKAVNTSSRDSSLGLRCVLSTLDGRPKQ